MEPARLDRDDELVKETDDEQLVCAGGSLEICGVSGYPNLNPRIGDDYQVRIPPLQSLSEAISDASLRFLVGLPISIVLIHDNVDSRDEKELRLLGHCVNTKTYSKSGKGKKHGNAAEKLGSKVKDEPLDDDRSSVHCEKEKQTVIDETVSKLKDEEPLDDDRLVHCEKKHNASEKVGSKLKDEQLGNVNVPPVHCEKKHKAVEKIVSKQKDGETNGGSSVHSKKKKLTSMEKVGSKLKDEPLNERSVKPEKATCYFVPGSLGSCWNEDEVESFILGLYIFGKSFVPVKKFVDNKDMGDILSFYYGRFYGCDRYKRWSDCRKVKRRKCISGEKLFTGWRQQELISRLQPHISESYHKTFQETSEAMAEGRIPLADYVCSLKAAVGIRVLAEAIGIGKGKEDLTNPAMETMKSNPAASKSCSSLTPNDIATLLTGGFRLSKARCTDIFWEAVWPRLLARGWHSEQPNSLMNYLDAKTNLVFLVPGVKKYSRRDLVKGFHYFDSVADVLSKVASEPKLLELHEAGEENNDDSFASQSRSYLKPRVSNGNAKSVKFTVVDSSSITGGGGLVKMKKMRYSPRDLVVASMVTRVSAARGSLSIEDSKADEEDEEKENPKDAAAAAMMMVDETKTRAVPNTDKAAAKFTIVDTSRGRSSSNKLFELRDLPSDEGRVACRWIKPSDENRKTAHDHNVDGYVNNLHTSDELPPQPAKPCSNTMNNCNVDQSTKPAAPAAAPVQQFSRRSKSSHSNNLVPLVKRRRLTACISTEMSHVMESCAPPKLEAKEENGSKEQKVSSAKKNTLKVIFRPPRPNPSTPSAEPCAANEERVRGGAISKTNDVSGAKRETAESLPGLNLQPQRQLHSEPVRTTEHVASEPRNLDPERMPDCNNPASSTNPESRRTSTRNRPLTTRALEALQYEFLEARKRPRSSRQEESGSSSSRRARSKKIKATTSSTKLDGGGSSIDEQPAAAAAAMDPESCSSQMGGS